MRKEVLDHGFIELIDFMGSDRRILQTARISTGAEPVKGDVRDRGLIRYLYRNNHVSPMESCTFTFRVKAPIFVARQWFRHRSMSFSEVSARYTTLPNENYTPEHFRSPGATNHQGSGQALEYELDQELLQDYTDHMDITSFIEDHLRSNEVANELTRLVVPVARYTEFYFTVNLRNLLHFLTLRLHEHAQYEIRVYAVAILEIMKMLDDFKWTVEVFEDMLELDYLFQRANKNHIELSEVLKKFIAEYDL